MNSETRNTFNLPIDSVFPDVSTGEKLFQAINFQWEGRSMPTHAQLALIHIAKKELRLTEDLYRDILYCLFQKDSASELTFDEVAKLINHFKWLGWRPASVSTTRPTGKPARSANALATPAQQRKIVAMWMTGQEIHQKNTESLRHFLNNRFHVPDLPYVKASQVTAILAAIRRMSHPPRIQQNQA